MKSFIAAAALVGAAIASPVPQGSMPAGCMASYPGSFGLNIVNVTQSTKRDVQAVS